MKRFLAATSLLGGMCLSGLPTASQAQTALPVILPAPTALQQIRDGQPMRMVYELDARARLFIIPVSAKATFAADLRPETYSMTSNVRTTGLADIFVNYDLANSAAGYVNADGLTPYRYVSQNNDGKKNRRVEMVYGADDVTMTATPRFGNLGFPPATPAQKLAAHDPISALIDFSLSPVAKETPCGGPITTFDGRQLTRLTLTYQGRSKVKTKVFSGEAIECFVKLDRVAGYKEGEKGSNLSGIDGPMRMWIAPLKNGLHLPVKITVDTEDIGRVTLEASKFSLEPVAG